MSDIAIEVCGASVRRGSTPILEDISFTVSDREFLGIVGPNGAGKTTLMRAILGLVPLSAGSIQLRGPERGLRGGVGYVPQQISIPTRFPASVLDVVRWGGLRRPRPVSATRAREWLARVGIEALASRSVGALSGGETQRVLLAQALCAGRGLLLLDEATTGLDLPAEQAFYHLLRELKNELGLAIIAVSHDLLALGGEADQLICINRTMHVHGNPAEVVHSHALQEAYSCEFDFLRGELAHHEHLGPQADAYRDPESGPRDPTD